MNDSDLPEALNGPFQRIKLAPGVLGNTMYLGGLVIISFIVAMIVRPDLVQWILVLAFVLFVIYVLFSGWFGSKFPIPALLGGAHLVKALEDALAAQGRVIEVDGVPVQNPALASPSPPPLNESATDGE